MIRATSIEIKFNLRNKIKMRNWVKSIILQEGKSVGDIAFVFCNDKYLGSLNEKYLHHSSLTDIITFDYSDVRIIAGDICISIERVQENAVKYNKTFDEELGRVMAHGILHLTGYKDKKEVDKKMMRSKEDFYLNSCPNL